jgi:hypothetical protein
MTFFAMLVGSDGAQAQLRPRERSVVEDHALLSREAEGPNVVASEKSLDSLCSPPVKKFRGEAAIIPSGSVKLSNEQQQVLDFVKEGKSVFFTGSAGNTTNSRSSA